MKKILLGLAAAAALLTVSCQKGLVEGGSSPDGTAKVSVDLSFPTIQTRAYSDGTTATQLQYAVYENTTDGLTLISALTHSIEGENAETINIRKQVDFQLVTGRKYTFVFWADAPSGNGWTSPYTVAFKNDGATMTANYEGAVANDERYDAFFASVDKQITGDVQMSVELTRPFAQINVGTSDFKAAKDLTAAPTLSSMTIKKAYTGLNLIDGTVTDDEPVEINLDYGLIAGTGTVEAETFPVKGYDYLAMAYVLADTEKEVVEVKFGYKGGGAKETTRTVGSVPIQRNHRTNMFGQVLTSNASLNIIIVPEYEEPDHNYDQLLFAAAVGGSVTLTDDVEVPGELTFTKDAVVDLGGHEIKATGGTYGDALVIANGANVTMKNGTLNPSAGASEAKSSATVMVKSSYETHLTLEDVTVIGKPYAVYFNNSNTASTITIKSGTFYTESSENNGPAVYVQKGGKVVIEGGTFGLPGVTNNFLLNILDSFRAPNTERQPVDIIEVRGGTYYNFDPANNKAEGAGTNFVAKGYKSVETISGADRIYVVVPDDTIELTSEKNDLAGAITAFAESDATEATILFKENATYSLKAAANTQQVVWPSNKKLTFIGSGNGTVLENADYFTAQGCEIEFRDLALKVLENPTNHTAIGFKTAAKVTLTNVDIYGEFHAFTGDVTFNGCNFYFGGGGNNQTRYGLYCESAGKTIVTGCTFDTSSKNDDRETKGILVYSSQGNTEMGDIDIVDCQFKVTGKESTKAAVEIHSELFTKAGTLTITNTTWEKYQHGLWREIDGGTSVATTFYTVIVDGDVVQPGGTTR